MRFRRELERLAGELDEHLSTLAIDPGLNDISVSATQEHAEGELLADVLVLLIDEKRKSSAIIEIVQYFAHRYRWPELQRAVGHLHRQAVERGDPRPVRAYERMLEAFSDDWDDLELFPSLQVEGR